MFSTSSKIAFGYILLIGLLFGSVKYIYKQMCLLAERTELESHINDRRQTTHKIISKLYEIEIVSQTLHSGKSSELRTFNHKMKEVQLAIDTLQNQLTDSLQSHRLDTLRALLKYKSNNMRAVTKALKRIPTDEIYQQQFDSLLIQQDSLLNSSHIRRRVITHHNTYTIHHKPKGFFKRIADVFVPGKADSTEVNNVIQEEYTDTLEEAYNPIDTIASMLTDIQSKVLETRQKELRTLDAHVNRLRMAGSDLSRRVNQLLETIDREEQDIAQRKILQEQEIRNHAAWTMAAISIIAVVLVMVFFTIIWRDLTKSTHYRHELEKAKLYAENLLVAREKLMLTITHDIKAPTGSIIGYLDLLNRLITDKRQLFYLNNMKSSAQHLLNLITSLLDYHRLEAGKMDLNPVSFKPHQFLEDIYHSFIPLAEKKHITLNLQAEMKTNLTLEGDPFRLRQIVENLLSNALKFTDSGSITVQSSYKGNQFIIRISDTGCGMTAEEQHRIFNEFTRLHSAQGQEGFGLGLSITRKLIDLQHGKIRVDSIPNAGSTFEVSIPLPSLSEKTVNQVKTDAKGQSIHPLERLHFLLIDDDKIQLQLTAALLHQAFEPSHSQETKSGLGNQHLLTIDCSEDHEEVLSLLKKDKYDLVFTDIQMPNMNGFELLKAIRNLPASAGKEVPIIAITARGDMNQEEFIAQGFAGMLQKPFNLSDLREILTTSIPQKVQAEMKNNEACNSGTYSEGDHNCLKNIAEVNNRGNQENEFQFNFASLLAFSEGDQEAAREILTTFIMETEKNIDQINQSMDNKDFNKICEIGHKMLPTFTMLEAGPSVDALQWLESKRNQQIPEDEIREKTSILLKYSRAIIEDAQKRCHAPSVIN